MKSKHSAVCYHIMDPSGQLLPETEGTSIYDCQFKLVSALLYPITESSSDHVFIEPDLVESVWSAAKKCGWEIVVQENKDSNSETYSSAMSLPVASPYLN